MASRFAFNTKPCFLDSGGKLARILPIHHQGRYRNSGHSVATNSRPMMMLNHFSRTGLERKRRIAMPNSAQLETQGRLIRAKATVTKMTLR